MGLGNWDGEGATEGKGKVKGFIEKYGRGTDGWEELQRGRESDKGVGEFRKRKGAEKNEGEGILR